MVLYETFTTVFFGKNRPYVCIYLRGMSYFVCIRINWVSFFFLMTRYQSLIFQEIKHGSGNDYPLFMKKSKSCVY